MVFRCPDTFPYTDSARKYCYSSCEVGEYADNQLICRPCDSNCYTCYNLSTNCTSCVSPYELVYGFKCGCNGQSYELDFGNGTMVCVLCSDYIQGCNSCTSHDLCTSCMNNLVLSSPTSCDCPVDTTRQIIGRNVFCVSDSGTTRETCENGLI